MLKIVILSLLFLVILPSANAALVDCGTHEIDLISVQGNRDDNYIHANKLILRLKDSGVSVSCNGKLNLFLSNSDPAFNGILSMLMAAKVANRKVEVFANSSVAVDVNTMQIAWVTIR